MSDHLNAEERRALMRKVRTRDTAPELMLRRAMWAAGLRGWRAHPTGVLGRPDIAWMGRRLAVFVDGAFWHGHPDHYHGQSGEFWDRKIARNRERDREVNDGLERMGWEVVRVWDFEVERDAPGAVGRVRNALDRRVLDN